MFRRAILISAALMMTLLLGGCGSDSQKSGSTYAGKKVALKATGSIPAGLTIAAIQMTLNFPQGVTVETVTDPASQAFGEPTANVVKLVGGNAGNELVAASYTPATATGGSLRLLATNVNGFSPGEYIEINLDITPGFTPVAADFSLADFIVSDINGNEYPVQNQSLTVEFL